MGEIKGDNLVLLNSLFYPYPENLHMVNVRTSKANRPNRFRVLTWSTTVSVLTAFGSRICSLTMKTDSGERLKIWAFPLIQAWLTSTASDSALSAPTTTSWNIWFLKTISRLRRGTDAKGGRGSWAGLFRVAFFAKKSCECGDVVV